MRPSPWLPCLQGIRDAGDRSCWRSYRAGYLFEIRSFAIDYKIVIVCNSVSNVFGSS